MWLSVLTIKLKLDFSCAQCKNETVMCYQVVKWQMTSSQELLGVVLYNI